jgi:SAM-dependent methyltransferase
MSEPRCRFCDSPLRDTFVDLGVSPLSNAFLRAEQLHQMEPFYPLHARVCANCFLVQVEQFAFPEAIFRDYAYFSSFSESWLRHASEYADMAAKTLSLGPHSLVVEIASNDGYLLQYFQKNGIPVLGVEPAQNVAKVAEQKGIPTRTAFFGQNTAEQLRREGNQADLIVANNVLAHVPDLLDFVRGLKILLKESGTISVEFPHLWRLMEANQFDTIYHEHFSYFSFGTAMEIFHTHGLQIFDVEELPTHGGSLRLYARHADVSSPAATGRVAALQKKELDAGLRELATYARFAEKVRETKRALLDFLVRAKRDRKSVVAYGAPAKGNTLLNYCGIRTDFIDYAVDLSPYKQNLYTPGTHIPIYAPEKLRETRPDYVLILPWNLSDEIVQQNKFIREWGGRFVVPIPKVEVLP